MKLKVCGMRDSQNIQDLLTIEPDYMGFVFYEKSARNAVVKLDPVLLKSFPVKVKKVGVFVNEDIKRLKDTVTKFSLDLVQLHGDESPEYIQELKISEISIIKAFSIDENFDFDLVTPFIPFVDYFLFDTKGEKRGGNGDKFNWELLKKYGHEVPFFLSGGINMEDVDDIFSLKDLNIHAIDVNSKFETAAAYKNIEDLKHFKNELDGKIDK